MKLSWSITVLASLLISGCASPTGPATEKGPQGTIAYIIAIDSSQPGAKIELNYKLVGTTPMTVKVFGDRDGTFHNFGSDEYTIRAYPPSEGNYPQTKIFKTGAFGVKDDKIPEKVFFDFGRPEEKSK